LLNDVLRSITTKILFFLLQLSEKEKKLSETIFYHFFRLKFFFCCSRERRKEVCRVDGRAKKGKKAKCKEAQQTRGWDHLKSSAKQGFEVEERKA